MEANEVFEEWNAYARKKAQLGRDLDFRSLIENSKVKIVAITGIRRARSVCWL